MTHTIAAKKYKDAILICGRVIDESSAPANIVKRAHFWFHTRAKMT